MEIMHKSLSNSRNNKSDPLDVCTAFLQLCFPVVRKDLSILRNWSA